MAGAEQVATSPFVLISAALVMAALFCLSGYWAGRASARRWRSQLRKEIVDSSAALARREDEMRRLIGVELHNQPSQDLAFVLMRLDEVEQALTETVGIDSDTLDALIEIRAAVRDALGTLRKMSALLAEPDPKGLQSIKNVLQTAVHAAS